MKDVKYSLEIMQEHVRSPYISPENKYAFETSISMLQKANKLKELISIYKNLLAQLKDLPTTGVTIGKARIVEMIISDLEDLIS